MNLLSLHHVAIICSDYARSKAFYTEILSLKIISEIYRPERHSYKLNLAVPGGGEIELFSFPSPPSRPTRPEALGLRHLAFSVDRLDDQVDVLVAHSIPVEPVRLDEITGQRFAFFSDPDGLPIELYETKK